MSNNVVRISCDSTYDELPIIIEERCSLEEQKHGMTASELTWKHRGGCTDPRAINSSPRFNYWPQREWTLWNRVKLVLGIQKRKKKEHPG